MRYFYPLLISLILFLQSGAAQPQKITLIGLSGSTTKLATIFIDHSGAYSSATSKEVAISPMDVWRRFYLNRTQRGDTLVCEYSGKRLYIVKGSDSAFIDSDAVQLSAPLTQHKKKLYLNTSDFALLMNSVAHDLAFKYTPATAEVRVTRPLTTSPEAKQTPLSPSQSASSQSTKSNADTTPSSDGISKSMSDTTAPPLSATIFEVEQPQKATKPKVAEPRVKQNTSNKATNIPTTTTPSTASILVPKEVAPSQSIVVKRTWKQLTGAIVLDPGHGGKDPGAIGPDSTTEKEVVLAMALYAQSFIQRNSGVTALLTRDNDVFVPLRGRTRFANSKGAQLFVSIHANATADGRAKGFKMYFLSDAKNESDQRTALLENAVMEFEEEEEETDMVHSILLDMMSSEFLIESQKLSIELAKTFTKRLPTRKLHTGIGQANFYVLHGASMPAVLVETAFISNIKEEKLLMDEKFQRKSGDAIGRAVLNFLQEMSINHE